MKCALEYQTYMTHVLVCESHLGNSQYTVMKAGVDIMVTPSLTVHLTDPSFQVFRMFERIRLNTVPEAVSSIITAAIVSPSERVLFVVTNSSLELASVNVQFAGVVRFKSTAHWKVTVFPSITLELLGSSVIIGPPKL